MTTQPTPKGPPFKLSRAVLHGLIWLGVMILASAFLLATDVVRDQERYTGMCEGLTGQLSVRISL